MLAENILTTMYNISDSNNNNTEQTGFFLVQYTGKETYPERRSTVDRRTIEILQRARIFQSNCCLKVHNAHSKLASPISG